MSSLIRSLARRPARRIWQATALTCTVVWIKNYVAEPCTIVGPSMAPSLSPRFLETGEHDQVLLWKGRYTHMLRNTAADIKMQQMLEEKRKLKGRSPWNKNDVRRGDVVAFWSPYGGGKKIGVKRVVALGGDTVEVRGRKRYGDKYREVDSGLTSRPARMGEAVAQSLGEEGDFYWQRGQESDRNRTVVVPYGHVWVEGDNAERSEDSRDFGPISLALITGKVKYIIWPWSRIGPVPARTGQPSSKVSHGIAEQPTSMQNHGPGG